MAAPCPPWLKEAWIDWISPEAIMELYAGAEAQSATIIAGTEWLAHRGSVRKVAVGEMAAFDEAGERLPPSEIGEIYLLRPNELGPSYAYRGATARTLPGGWESPGDIGSFDEESIPQPSSDCPMTSWAPPFTPSFIPPAMCLRTRFGRT